MDFTYIKNYQKNTIYPYTHSDAVYTDELEKTTLTDSLNDIHEKLKNASESSQSDWNETDSASNSYILNKPRSLPANGGNADTLSGRSVNEFTLKTEFDSHQTDLTAHKNLFDKKLSTEIANTLLKESSFDSDTGVLSFTRLNGSSLSFNIPKSLVFKSALFEEETNEIVITWSDKSKSRIPVEGLVDIYTGSENNIIQIVVSEDNKISATIKNDSITRSLLSPDIQTELNDSQNHITDLAKHLPEGATNGKFLGVVSDTCAWIDIPQKEGDPGTSDYNELNNKPSINSIELSGNKSFSDLGITADSIGADATGSASNALESAKTYVDDLLIEKVDKVHNMGLSSNDYTTDEKQKLMDIEPKANNYIHPESHPAAMIIEDSDHQFVTEAEKALIGTGGDTSGGIQDISFEKESATLTLTLSDGTKNIDLSSLRETIIIGNGDELTPGFNQDMVWKKLELDTTIAFSKADYLGGKFIGLGSTNFIAVSDNPPDFTVIDLTQYLTDTSYSLYLTNVHYWQNKWYILGFTEEDMVSYVFSTENFIDLKLSSLTGFLYGLRGLYFDGVSYSLIGSKSSSYGVNNTKCLKYSSLEDSGYETSYNIYDGVRCDGRVEVSSKMYVSKTSSTPYTIIVGNIKSAGIIHPDNTSVFQIDKTFYGISTSSSGSKVGTTLYIYKSEPNSLLSEELFYIPKNIMARSEIYGIYCNSKYLITKNGKGIFLSEIKELQNYIFSEENWFKISSSPLTSLSHNYNYVVGTESGGGLIYAKIN